MAAPNRSDVIKRVLLEHAHAVHVPEGQLEDRRRRFLPVFIAAMPVDERGNWGLLLKTDKNPDFIPSDILVWRPTMEHIDVTSANALPDGSDVIVPVWKNHGVIGKTDGTKNKVGLWIWHDVKAANIPPLPAKPDGGADVPTDRPPDDPDSVLFERMLIQSVERIADGVEDMAISLRTIAARVEKI